jgi:hypothetical protein
MNRFFKTYEHFSRSFLKKAKELTGRSQKMPHILKMLEDAYKVDEIFELKQPFTSAVYNKIYCRNALTDEEFNQIAKDIIEEIQVFKNTKEWAKINGNYSIDRTTTSEFDDLIKTTKNKNGIYFLYNDNKELIYIGKSISDISYRSFKSAIYRNAEYIKIYYPKTKADTSIYELYYINKFKPICNKDSKENDETTIELPELDCSKLIKIYKDTMAGDSYD